LSFFFIFFFLLNHIKLIKSINYQPYKLSFIGDEICYSIIAVEQDLFRVKNVFISNLLWYSTFLGKKNYQIHINAHGFLILILVYLSWRACRSQFPVVPIVLWTNPTGVGICLWQIGCNAYTYYISVQIHENFVS